MRMSVASAKRMTADGVIGAVRSPTVCERAITPSPDDAATRLPYRRKCPHTYLDERHRP